VVTTGDPRIERTRALVLHHGRLLLAEEGPAALTYSSLAARARVTRQTLYRHWPTRQQLIVDMLLEGPFLERIAKSQPETGSRNARIVVRDFLRGLRDGFDVPSVAGPMAALIGESEHDQASREALRDLVDGRLAYLNNLLAASGVVIEADELSTLSGSLIAHRFVNGSEVSDEYIDFLVESWWMARSARRRKESRDTR
jgi:AcrR family transcriptional regulator